MADDAFNNDELPSDIFDGVNNDFDLENLLDGSYWANLLPDSADARQDADQDAGEVGDNLMILERPEPSVGAPIMTQEAHDPLSTSLWAQLTGWQSSANGLTETNKSGFDQSFPPLPPLPTFPPWLASSPLPAVLPLPPLPPLPPGFNSDFLRNAADGVAVRTPAESTRRRNFTALQVFHLETWLKAHLDCPYPGHDDKTFLETRTGLDVRQIEAWFSRNRRKRVRAARVNLVQGVTTESVGSNVSLDVLRSSILSDERAQQDPSKRWSDSHLPQHPPEDTEQLSSLEQWSSTHFDWWLYHLPSEDSGSSTALDGEGSGVPATNQDGITEVKTFNLQYLNSPGDKSSNGSQLAPSSVPASLSVVDDGFWSGGSSISGFSRISSHSYSSRLFKTARRPSRRQHRSSSVSMSSLSRSNSRAGASQPDVPDIPDIPSISNYKRRKLGQSTTSVVSNWSQGSEQSHTSHKRRRGKRLSDLAPASAPVALPRPNDDFWCTFCPKTFKDAFRWQRHEEAVHVPTKLWICRPVFPDSTRTADPTVYSFTAAGCWVKHEKDRTFWRKDAMTQHLSLVHKLDYEAGSVNSIADELCTPATLASVDLPCPFCLEPMSTRPEMVEHMRDHFSKKTAIWPFQRIDVPDEWSNPPCISSTTLHNVEPFVSKGRDMESSHPLQWRCPACPYSTCASLNSPYFHACSEHWFELSDLVPKSAPIDAEEEIQGLASLSPPKRKSKVPQKIRGWRNSMATYFPSQLRKRRHG